MDRGGSFLASVDYTGNYLIFSDIYSPFSPSPPGISLHIQSEGTMFMDEFKRHPMVHPDDNHLLDDWYNFGPKDTTIFELVSALAQKGMRVHDIEELIETALRAKLTELEEQPSGKSL